MDKDSDAPLTPPDARRGFLKQVIGGVGALPFAQGLAAGSAAALATVAEAASPGPVVNQVLGYVSFSPGEAAFVEAMLNVMCPADELTPNGVDCGLAVYMDRQLAGDFGRGAGRYMRGPWMAGRPEQGPQLPLTPSEFFKVGLEAASSACTQRFGRAFDQLGPADANAFLLDLGAGKVKDARVPLDSWFNDLVYPLFQQACFADPIYGGNVDKVFWKLIGYPGLPATNTLAMVQYRGKPVPGARDPKSIADFS
ncbi:gluconate 2-dehydrogenase subunit 3 family protein [Roseateles sp.]|uniref:gluconate 2-dehydrogenase subunit 3 family protein n=1 Tax=Roseateles sp. TaxID=1971397 RepID=UPI0025FA030A|nr:gluconate 2-dehydrogenase subunit 3 family protein [Roseateles sp.]MBV8034704.1 gluconate 2-dehydrogenase subunit 3 family protein [Roseateles sp.]